MPLTVNTNRKRSNKINTVLFSTAPNPETPKKNKLKKLFMKKILLKIVNLLYYVNQEKCY